MAKYGQYSRRPPLAKRPWEIHPIWRGIGCILLILIPLMAYTGAVLLVQENQVQGWFPLPADFTRTVGLPVLGNVPYLFANLAVALVLAIVGYVILIVLYALIYRLVGPPQYGPLDAPPDQGRARRR